jgi:hypothetical protein
MQAGTDSPAAASAATPQKPSILQRMGLLREKKAESGREVYVKLIRREAAGEELTDRDVEAFAAAMDAAGIDERQHGLDLQMFHEYAGAVRVAQQVGRLRSTLESAEAELSQFERRHATTFTKLDELRLQVARASNDMIGMDAQAAWPAKIKADRPDLFAA